MIPHMIVKKIIQFRTDVASGEVGVVVVQIYFHCFMNTEDTIQDGYNQFRSYAYFLSFHPGRIWAFSYSTEA